MSYVKHFKRLNGALPLAVLRTVTTETAVSPIFTKKEPALEADPCLFIALQYEEECERLFIVAKIQDSRRLNECSAQRKMRPRVHKYPDIFENGFFSPFLAFRLHVNGVFGHQKSGIQGVF